MHEYGRMRRAYVPGLASLPRSGAAETFVPTPTSTCLWWSSRGVYIMPEAAINNAMHRACHAQRAALLPHEKRACDVAPYIPSCRGARLG